MASEPHDHPASKLPDWQLRVVAEKAALEEKTYKLNMFLLSIASHDLPEMDRHLLVKQYNLMYGYCAVLGERVSRFDLPATI